MDDNALATTCLSAKEELASSADASLLSTILHYVRMWLNENECFNLRFNVHPVNGLLAMEVRMMERTSENLADGEGGQHQSRG